jgi:hypothetical protein
MPGYELVEKRSIKTQRRDERQDPMREMSTTSMLPAYVVLIQPVCRCKAALLLAPKPGEQVRA